MYQYYIIEEEQFPLFVFTPNNQNVYYKVLFEPIELEFNASEMSYTFSFDYFDAETHQSRPKKDKQKYDQQISQTLVEIVYDFAIKNPALILFYQCDNSDKRNQFRNKLFNTWFEKTKKEDSRFFDFQKVSKIIYDEVNKIEYYLAIIYQGVFFVNASLDKNFFEKMSELEEIKI